jgi:hypothetical protein
LDGFYKMAVAANDIDSVIGHGCPPWIRREHDTLCHR